MVREKIVVHAYYFSGFKCRFLLKFGDYLPEEGLHQILLIECQGCGTMWHLVAAVVYHGVVVRFADHDKLRQKTPLGTFDSIYSHLAETSVDHD